MADISLMGTLLNAVAGNVELTPTEVEHLVYAAEGWLRDHGWESHWSRGWSNAGRAFGPDEDGGALIIRERRRGFWDATGVRHPIGSVAKALNVLANEGILPARFSTLGRAALLDHAEVCERAAVVMGEELDKKPYSQTNAQDRLLTFARMEGLRLAADSARRFDHSAVLA